MLTFVEDSVSHDRAHHSCANPSDGWLLVLGGLMESTYRPYCLNENSSRFSSEGKHRRDIGAKRYFLIVDFVQIKAERERELKKKKAPVSSVCGFDGFTRTISLLVSQVNRTVYRTVWYSQKVTKKHNDKKPIPLAGLLEKRNSIWLRIWLFCARARKKMK